MNKERRKILLGIVAKLNTILEVLDEQRDAEEQAYENMPEGLQSTERGDDMQDNIVLLEDAILALGEAVDNLDTILSK